MNRIIKFHTAKVMGDYTASSLVLDGGSIVDQCIATAGDKGTSSSSNMVCHHRHSQIVEYEKENTIRCVAVCHYHSSRRYIYRHRFDKYEQSQEEQAAGIKAIGKDSRFLVAYFSWPSPDYPDLDATSGASNIVKDGKLYGNTEYIAEILSKKLNADLFRIETVRSYPTEPKALLDETKVENTSHMKPELKSRVENFSDYDVIFVGYPLWWYDMPMAIYSFLEGYDFSGKTIVLFTTHGGNRFCRTVPTVRKLFPKANVVQGPAIYDREMDKAEQSLDKWLKDKGF